MQSTSVIALALHRIGTSWTWYVIRGAGFVAAALLVLLILSGIGQVTGFTYRLVEPVKAWAIHKAIALAMVAVIFIHVLFILIDRHTSFTIPQVLIPFASQYSNGSALPLATLGLGIALGILATYGVIVLVLTSLGWIQSRPRTWNLLHYLSYFVALAIFLHALYVGTDLKYGTFRAAWLLLGALITLAVIYRLWRARTLRRKAPEHS